MKQFILLTIILFSLAGFGTIKAQSASQLVDFCAMNAGDDATYLKDFIVELGAGKPDEKPPVFKASLALKGGTLYRFSICNSDASSGTGVLEVYDGNKVLLSTFNPNTGQHYKSVNFQCNKTSIYHIFISFQDGKAGMAVGILSFIKML